MRDLIRRARRRLVLNRLLMGSVSALSAAFAVLIVFLVAGTGALGLYGPAAALLFAAIAGVWLTWRPLPSAYRTAQLVDARMELADTLSTSAHFVTAGDDGETARCQREQAERLAVTIDLSRALPYTLPRTAYLLVALALIAGGICVLRYGILRRLDLKPSLAQMVRQRLDLSAAPASKRTAPGAGAPPADSLEATDQATQPGSGETGREASFDGPAPPATSPEGKSAPEKEGAKPGQNSGTQSAEEGDQAGSRSDSTETDSQQPGAKEKARGETQADENSSLLSKVKDALQNLLSRALPRQQNQGAVEPSAANRRTNQPAAQAQPSPLRQGQNGQQGDEADAEARQEAAPDGPQAQSKPGENSNGQQASKQPGSGAGSSEGDKTLRQAEQLAAMGKISRIIAKRSASVTGEAMVEVESATQQLRAPYAPGNAHHTQGGAEINRDEIPVALQGYVEQYFEQLRKQAAAKK